MRNGERAVKEYKISDFLLQEIDVGHVSTQRKYNKYVYSTIVMTDISCNFTN